MSTNFMKNCHFCKSFNANISDIGTEYRCGTCINLYKMNRVSTYYIDEDTIFAISFAFNINGRSYAAESYFKGAANEELVDNSVIYCHDNGERIFIPGHPFTIENVKNKTKIYVLFS